MIKERAEPALLPVSYILLALGTSIYIHVSSRKDVTIVYLIVNSVF